MSVFRTPRRRAATVGIAVAGLGILSAPAWAYYLVTVSGTPSGAAVTSALGAGATPTVQPDATVSLQLDLSWTASSLSSVTPTVNATGYEVLRYSAASGGTGTHVCGTTPTSFVATTSCNDLTTSATTWYYTVIPHYQGWAGAESATRGSGTSGVIGIAPSAPASVSLSNGGGASAAYINSGNSTSVNFDVRLPSTSLPTDTVHLTVADAGTGLFTAPTHAGTTGAGTLHFNNLDLSSLADGGLSVNAWVTNAAGTSSNATLAPTKDTSAPSLTLALADPTTVGKTRYASLSGSTLSFQPCMSGAGFRIVATVDDGTGTGAASAAFPAVAGVTKWTDHASETISTPSGGPYSSTDYLYSAPNCTNSAGTPAGNYTATASDVAGNTASSTFTFSADSTAPTVTAITLNNGGVAGQVDANDYVELTYSETLNAKSLCSAWSNGSVQSISGVTATITKPNTNSTNNTLTVATSSSCTLGLGTVTIPRTYNTSTASMTFSNATVRWDPSTNKLRITLGGTQSGGTMATGVSASPPTYKDAAQSETDLVGNQITNSTFTTTASSAF